LERDLGPLNGVHGAKPHGNSRVIQTERVAFLMILEEEFEDTKGVIRIRISKKNRQHNGQKKKYKSPPDFPTPNLIHKIYFLVNLSDRH
jgi:hypothetical protein